MDLIPVTAYIDLSIELGMAPKENNNKVSHSSKAKGKRHVETIPYLQLYLLWMTEMEEVSSSLPLVPELPDVTVLLFYICLDAIFKVYP